MAKLGRYSADRKKIEALSAAKTVEVADCGTVFIVAQAAGAAYDIALPTPAAAGKGWWCKFILGTAAAKNVTITGAANSINSVELGALAGDADTLNNPGNTITFIGTDGARTNEVGDQVELVSDGSAWYALCASGLDGGITVADV
mgnify:CR=1 FL=1